MENEANLELEILSDDAGAAGGISTQSAITAIGAGILCFFLSWPVSAPFGAGNK